ncbi:hypothetical protein B0H10DRAFT_2041009 [Mycena sp. CBHHK59/15]|nr:hypothetical protein B0H10DRAFT_2041009 [Mycena sp. CBHHK59/15]
MVRRWKHRGAQVVQAENTQFHVYKGTLCNHSEVLKQNVENMEDSEGVEGCPLLHLSDATIEVENVFRTVFYRWSYPDTEPLSFGVIAVFLRLGRKYRIQPLYDNALV